MLFCIILSINNARIMWLHENYRVNRERYLRNAETVIHK